MAKAGQNKSDTKKKKPSSVKRAKQNEQRRLRNRANLSTMKTAIRKVKDAVSIGKVELLDDLMKSAESVIARTKRKGAIHRNNMARRISRLALLVNRAKHTSKDVSIL